MNKRITTALAATMVCALTLGLAGCEGQVPQTVAPSVKDNEIIDVTVAQEKQIRGKILDVLNQANEAKSTDGLAARVSGSQLEIRTAQLNIAQYTQQDVTPLATIPSDVTQVVIPTDNAWPRYIFHRHHHHRGPAGEASAGDAAGVRPAELQAVGCRPTA